MPIILGIDPGLATIGFGVIGLEKKDKPEFVDCGIIKTPAKMELPERLSTIKKDVTKLFKEYKPDAVGVEEIFFARNVTNAIKVAHARGVILEAISDFALGSEAAQAPKRRGFPIYEFTPLQIKNNICGYGQADKKQMQEMVKRFLNLKKHPKPDDAADALGVAICTARMIH